MDYKDIFSTETEVGAANTKTPRIIPKWAVIATAVVLLVVMLVGGIFIGLNINGVDASVKQMSNKLPALDDIYALIDKYYYKDIDWDSVQDKTIAGMLALDQFSGVSIQETGAPMPMMGIRFFHSIYNETFVFNTSKSSPAKSAIGVEKNFIINNSAKSIAITDKVGGAQDLSIERGDQIIAFRPANSNAEFLYIVNMSFDRVQLLLQSSNNVDLAFKKPDGRTYTVSIQKTYFDDFTPIAEYFNMGALTGEAKHNSVGYISLSEYDVTRIDEFAKAIHEFKADTSANKLILDLRDNGGGDVEMVQKIAPYLMDINGSSPLMQFVDKKGSVDTAKSIDYSYNNAKQEYLGKSKAGYQIVVLTNGNTASASEATLGLLRYYEPSTYTIGVPTYGKGVAQVIIPNVAGKYTVSIVSATFNLPYKGDEKGWKNFHGVGMVPDYNYNDRDKATSEYGRLYANLIDEIEIIKALEYLTK